MAIVGISPMAVFLPCDRWLFTFDEPNRSKSCDRRFRRGGPSFVKPLRSHRTSLKIQREEFPEERIQTVGANPDMSKLTVAICTYNRAEYLDRCLSALGRQVCSPDVYDVIVVDNASTDETKKVICNWASRDNRISYFYEPVPGLARARNLALRHATAPLISYTDDDAIVPENWVSLLVAGFSSLPSSVFAIGGEIDPVFECERPSWLTNEMLRILSAQLSWSDTPRFLQGDEWICEVNSAYRVEQLRKYGGFPEELGRQADLLLSGENFVNDVARRDGFLIYFDPGIRVSHFIPASRLTKDWFRRRSFWQGVTVSMFPRIAKSRYGFRYERLRQVRLPMSPSDWINLLSDEGEDTEFMQNCGGIEELGYFLGFANLITSR